jgi:hypothetical protein
MKKLVLFLSLSLFLAFSLQVGMASHALAGEEAPAAKSGGGEGGEGGKDKKKGNDITGGRFEGDPIYVHIAPMVLPVINDNGAEQLITIIFDVQVKNFDAADAMQSNMPKVMDSLLRSLYGGLGQGALRNGKLVNVGRVKTKAMSAVGEIIGNDNVQDVLIQGVSQRML